MLRRKKEKEKQTFATLPVAAAVVEAERVEDFLRWKENQGVRVEGGHHPERGVSAHLEDNVLVGEKKLRGENVWPAAGKSPGEDPDEAEQPASLRRTATQSINFQI